MNRPLQNLQTLFASAKAQKKALGETETNRPSYRDQLQDVISQFEECQRLIGQLCLFSTNESVEDIATGDLQYLTVDFLLAELLQTSYSPDRMKSLQRTREEYEKYLETLDAYGLFSPVDKKLYDRYIENPTAFTLAPMNDAVARRDVKISRLREEKELNRKLEYLSQNQNKLQNDDEPVRQLYLSEITLDTHHTFQALDMLSQELSILSSAQAAGLVQDPIHNNDPRRRDDSDRSGFSDRLDTGLSRLTHGRISGPLLSRDGVPLQPFTLTSRRVELQKGVFRPSHNLPTMSIDEYLEEERKRGGIIEGGGEPPAGAKGVDEDDLDKADEETMKARAWDEFREDNPRGSGNTLNRG